MPPAAGGATEKSWDGLSREFTARGHEVTVISRQWPGWPDTERIGDVCHQRLRGFSHTARLSRNLWRDFCWSLRVWLALPPADITIVNCVALPVWLGWLRRSAGRLVVMTGRMPKGQYRIYRRVDRVLAVSSGVRNAILGENPSLAPVAKIYGCPIAWNTLATARPALPLGAPLTIGFVGRLHREKGLELFVAALSLLAQRSELPAWRVLLCGPDDVAHGGSGPEYTARLSRTLAAALPVDRFEIRAPVYDVSQLAEVYQAIDVFCYPSLATHGETFGVAIAEAMAAGAVPVVSQLDCFTDLVSPGRNGETFDHTAPDAPTRLAAVLEALLRDAPRRSRLAKEAQDNSRIYDFPEYATRLLEDFSALK